MNKNVLFLIAFIIVILSGFDAQNSHALLPAADEAGEGAVTKAAEEQKKEKALIAWEAKVEKEKAKERDALLVNQIKERMVTRAIPQEGRNAGRNINLMAIVFGALVFIGFYLIRGRRYKNIK
ncbi:MAG: hypothetical protein WC658_00975 [Candidatus Omnitrophota bacterium]